MEFTCTKENLLHGLSQVVPAAGRNTQLPILKYVLLRVEDGVLHLTATDLEVGIHAVVAGKVGEDGGCAVLARQFLDYVQQLPANQPIKITFHERTVQVETIGFKASFSTASHEDFPFLPTISQEREVALDGGALVAALSGVIFAASREETRPEIHSVFVIISEGELRAAATDSFRLAEYIAPLSKRGKEEQSILLPLNTAQEVVRLFSGAQTVTASIQKSVVVFRGDGVELSSRLVEGEYPDYQQIIPHKLPVRIRGEREQLIQALKTVAIFLPRDSRRVHVTVRPQKKELLFQVKDGEIGTGSATVEVEGEGAEVVVTFNIHYLLDGLQHITTAACEIELGSADQPAVFQAKEGNSTWTYVVMPIQT